MNSKRNEWLAMEDEVLLRDCVQDFHKSSGHGGQKVNKTSTAVRLTHKPSGLVASDASSRSQTENRSHALKKLRWQIALEFREAFPSVSDFQLEPASSITHDRYPLWMALVLDCLSAVFWNQKEAAAKLSVTPSKLLRLLYRDSALWQELNSRRANVGLPPWKGPE